MDLVLSVLGIVLSLAIAYWEHRKAKLADAHLEALATTLPEKILAGVRQVLLNMDPGKQESNDGWSLPGTKSEKSPCLRTRYADLDDDGTDELLIEVPSGTHASALIVYGRKDWDFQKIADLYSSTGLGFDIKDSDGDGRLEVETVEIARRPGLPYVCGLRDRVTYKLIGSDFVEIGRIEGWDQSDLDRLAREGNENAKHNV